MNKHWQPYSLHILDNIAKVGRIRLVEQHLPPLEYAVQRMLQEERHDD